MRRPVGMWHEEDCEGVALGGLWGCCVRRIVGCDMRRIVRVLHEEGFGGVA